MLIGWFDIDDFFNFLSFSFDADNNSNNFFLSSFKMQWHICELPSQPSLLWDLLFDTSRHGLTQFQRWDLFFLARICTIKGHFCRCINNCVDKLLLPADFCWRSLLTRLVYFPLRVNAPAKVFILVVAIGRVIYKI